MTEDEARRIVRARALMWQNASSDEQAKWLRYVEDFDAQMEVAWQRTAYDASQDDSEASGRRLRVAEE